MVMIISFFKRQNKYAYYDDPGEYGAKQKSQSPF